ncbi:Fe-S cluster assembly protein SufD [Rhodoblastus acidophilus]|uniref:Fe-S cluster assembly protein SufD n=1 Tax=Rhodoblastus acidophilus TaxID=1074 RepID=A0A6N8DTP3_RHOAC|nr:SufD family Fe-S cluster assembly protein [Rhodoblastus acidophilus]MCW2275247.1 Fe-S cluster assembly protein SufD [Rhodoblastus acidophilus]MTV32214.1 Fe-S cluster assembly protein SufD [Rhodoblastus acidophilus]
MTGLSSKAEDEFGRLLPADVTPSARLFFDQFQRAGLPGRRVESWHYSDLRTKLRAVPEMAHAPDDAARAVARHKLEASERLRLVTVDGFFAPDLSDDISAVAGIDISPVGEAEFFGGAADPMLDLNAAFSRGGFLLDIAVGARIDRVIEIVALTGAETDRSRFGRSLIRLGAGARAEILETRDEGFAGFGDSALFIALGEDAQLDYACRCRETAGVEVQTVNVMLAARATLRAVSLLAQTPFLRRQFFVSLAGEGAELKLAGAVILGRNDHADMTMVVHHNAPACVSREIFKYVLGDHANGVFQGKIVVPPHAQKTDGKMMCRALLLSDEAAMSAKPELEIFADDVACGHGAAVTKLDAQQLFYLETRGVPHIEAEKILIDAFAADVFDALESEVLRDLLRTDLSDLLGEEEPAS